jgi:hypothetical protein
MLDTDSASQKFYRWILNPRQPVLPANFFIGITHYFIKPS